MVFLVFECEESSDTLFDFGIGNLGIYWSILGERFPFEFKKEVVMKVFLQNRDFRQLTINQWDFNAWGYDFYLAFLNYVADASFCPWRF